ncbi:phosphoribosyl-AMP cyclohydrolase [Fulvivirgaceae bacterium BMA10]|uniref:Phosphoribosyl-AMP cyclohydrolase n=1 Tax=Splendidivirga corallicola TaxID=3051826 RepID=A0ABT8KSX6_9BACT|nr:phosphoribosyl-AMP cyclohydrolase [Fulvivirgaceae bacterium BMA10]
MVTKEQVLEAQNKWGAGVVKIGSLKENRPECEGFANEFLDKLYSFEAGPVLFKPTKCAIEQFRPTKLKALSYFIAGEDRACQEDKGFAIQPWTKVRFENADFILEENRAIAMGNYYFTDLDGNEAKVEYTFGYKLMDGELKIDLHHSSFPYNPDITA